MVPFWLHLTSPNAKGIRLFRKILTSMGKDRLKQAYTRVFRPTRTWTRSREHKETVKGELYFGKDSGLFFLHYPLPSLRSRVRLSHFSSPVRASTHSPASVRGCITKCKSTLLSISSVATSPNDQS